MANVTSKFAKHQLRCCPFLYQDKKETKDVVTHQSNTGELISRHSASGRCRDWLIALPVCHSILFCSSYNMDLRLSMCLTTLLVCSWGKTGLLHRQTLFQSEYMVCVLKSSTNKTSNMKRTKHIWNTKQV